MSHKSGPLAIGGVGGSGTRVIAAILLRLGYHLGEDLNPSLDNLWFTMLFRRPNWWARQRNRRPLDRNIRVFVQAMHGRLRWTPGTVLALTGGHRDMTREYGPEWARARIRSMRTARGPDLNAVGWGWKEPNTHVMLAELADLLPTLRYIHVIRHGLDMALSKNQQQLHRWGSLYGVSYDHRSPEESSARYWLVANRQALEVGRTRLRGRFHVVNFDRLCRSPRQEVVSLLEFLGNPDAPADGLASLVEPPATMGRYRSQLSRFGHETIDEVSELLASLARGPG